MKASSSDTSELPLPLGATGVKGVDMWNKSPTPPFISCNIHSAALTQQWSSITVGSSL